MSNEIAEKGTVFVCTACGKRSHDRYGTMPIDIGWDEACVINSILCKEDCLKIANDRVVEVSEGGIVPTLPGFPIV